MKMDKIAGSQNDEFYTPEYAVKPILKYVRPHSRVWCPFDTERSAFVRLLRESGHSVASSHLEDGIDFFASPTPTHDEFDYIISNPPYSKKQEVLSRLFSFQVPFAMLIGVVGLFESRQRFQMFKSNKFEIMYLDKRVSYFRSFDDAKPALNPPFSSVYVCSGVLPSQIVFEEIFK